MDEPEKSKNNSERIARTLIDDIAAGLIAPGTRLDEHGLAAKFGTSRTPVREALARLTAQNILTSERGRGVFVSEYGIEELSQMFEAMRELEEICAKLAAKRLTLRSEAKILAAQRACASAAEASDRSAFLKANEAFHQAIYDATQNSYMAEIAAGFRYRTGPFRAKRYRTKEDMLSSIETHENLIKTIVGGTDAPSAETLRREISKRFIEVLETA